MAKFWSERMVAINCRLAIVVEEGTLQMLSFLECVVLCCHRDGIC